MRLFLLLAIVPSLRAPAVRAAAGPPAPATPAQADFVERRVRPVLVENCVRCHGPKKQMGGLRLDSRDTLLRGGDNGPVVEPGSPETSRLVQAVRHSGDLKMPPK